MLSARALVAGRIAMASFLGVLLAGMLMGDSAAHAFGEERATVWAGTASPNTEEAAADPSPADGQGLIDAASVGLDFEPGTPLLDSLLALPAGNADCLSCHDPGGGSTPTVDFSCGDVDFSTACRKCHWVDYSSCPTASMPYTTTSHNYSSALSCGGSGCHTTELTSVNGWAVPHSYVASMGSYFYSSNSTSVSPETLHRIHANPSLPAQSDVTSDGAVPGMAPSYKAHYNLRCPSCHAPAACSSCHGTVPHGEHTTATVTAIAATGTPAGDQGTLSATATASSCAAGGCHPSSAISTGAVYDSAAASVTKTGTWITGNGSKYVCGSAIKSNGATATVTASIAGEEISYFGYLLSSGGSALVQVDGATVATVSCYASTQSGMTELYRGSLPDTGTHTVTIADSNQSGQGGGKYITFDALTVYAPSYSAFVPSCDSCHSLPPFHEDTTTPSTTISGEGLGSWEDTLVTFSLSATDDGSGVAATYYSLGGAQPATYTGPVTVSEEGTTSVAFWSVDLAGNTEATNSATVLIDTAPPSITATPTVPANAAGWHNQDVTVHFSATDALSGVCSVTPDAVLDSEAASQSLAGAATDVAGNIATVAIQGINIDKTAPNTSDDATASYNDSATIALSAEDTLSGVASTRYSFDGGVTSHQGTVVTTTTSGDYTLTYWSVDSAGNTEQHRQAEFSVVCLPWVSLQASPTQVLTGQATTLSWASLNSSSVVISPGVGPVAPSGLMMVSPLTDTTYTVTATNVYGETTQSIHVRVLFPEAQPVGTFGAEYQDLVPGDATIANYDPTRFAVAMGCVRTPTGAALPDVHVTCAAHPEYGTVVTDAEGKYELPVEGGGQIGLDFWLTDFVETHRAVDVAWNQVTTVDDVTLCPVDTAATSVTFDEDSATVIVHRSSSTVDTDGTRACSVVFTGDNAAWGIDALGTETTLTTLDVRATEFKTPDAMPAQLPPTTAFTYCAELSADGYSSVRFAKPVAVWVDNFLDFPVGGAVPAGYFDRSSNRWIASNDGVVVRLLDTDADGIVDALDANGDGLADKIHSEDTTSQEVAGLSDPSVYPPNATYWRVEVDHFTPWDFNWPSYFAGPASPPTGDPPQGPWSGPHGGCSGGGGGGPSGPSGGDGGDSSGFPSHSTVNGRTGTYHEDIQLPGTGLSLHYASDRVPGYKRVLDIPISGASVPTSCLGIETDVSFAGHGYHFSNDASPNQSVHAVWDGIDGCGRVARGTVSVNVEIVYTYRTTYNATPYRVNGRSFGTASSGSGFVQRVVGSRTLGGLGKTYSLTMSLPATSTDAVGQGWTISAHHALSPTDPDTLYKGDGSLISRPGDTVSGLAGFAAMSGAVVGASGDPYVAAQAQAGWVSRVWRVDRNTGAKTVVAGNGSSTFNGEGRPATQTAMSPQTVGLLGEDILVTDYQNKRVYRIGADGILHVIAGTGDAETTAPPDGAIATATPVCPMSVAGDAFGNVYLVDQQSWSARRLYRIDTNGVMQRVFSGDGGLASLCLDTVGNIYCTNGHTVIKVTAEGSSTVVAGNGNGHGQGDPYNPKAGQSVAATSVPLDPTAVAVGSRGEVYVADSQGYPSLVRVVDTEGLMSNFVNTPAPYPPGGGRVADNIPATQFCIQAASTPVVVGPGGTVYFFSGGTLRQVKQEFMGSQVSAAESVFPDTNGLGYVVAANGRHKRTIDLATGSTLTSFAADAMGLLTGVGDQFGNTTTLMRPAVNEVDVTSPFGSTSKLSLDASGNLTAVTFPDASGWDFAYDAGSLLTQATDPDGHVFTHAYGSGDGHVTSVTDPEGVGFSFSAALLGGMKLSTQVDSAEGNTTVLSDHTCSDGTHVGTRTNAAGAVATLTQTPDRTHEVQTSFNRTQTTDDYSFDPVYRSGMLVQSKTTVPSGQLTRTTTHARSYPRGTGSSPGSLTVDTTQVNGRTYTASDDASAGVRTLISPAGRIMVASYNPATLLTRQVVTPGLLPTTLYFDDRGRLATATTGERTAACSYDASGNVASVTAPDGGVWTYQHDLLGRLIGEVRPDGQSLGFSYDAVGNLTSLTPATQATSTFGYDSSSRRLAWQNPVAASYNYSYDHDGHLTTVTTPSGRVVSSGYTYGVLTSAESTDTSITIARGKCGRINGATRGSEVASYAYDGGLVTSDIRRGSIMSTVSYAYNNDFRPVSVTYAGKTDALGYDPDGLLTTCGACAISRDASSGLPVSETATGYSLARGFSGYGELDATTMTVSGVATYGWGLTRDNAGRITSRTERLGGETRTLDYGYDVLGRLATVTCGGDVVEAYRYDANGNRIHACVLARGIDSTMTFDAADRIVASAEATYTTDADGFITSKETSAGITDYRYSALGEITTVTVPSGHTITYAYDAFSRRVSRSVDGTLTDRYLWADATHLLAVYPATGTVPVYRFTYADGRVPLSVETSGGTLRLLTDQVGTVRALVATDGTISQRIDRDSYGAVTSGTASFPLGFAGGLADAETGLVHFGAREYDPALGRWLSRDPIDFAGGDANLYGYVLGDPVGGVDPSGLFLGQMPPAPPGSRGWSTSQWDNGRYTLTDDSGRVWTAHPEDPDHWRHWDIQDQNGKDKGTWPNNPGRPRPNQNKTLTGQSDCDPSGDSPEWHSPLEYSNPMDFYLAPLFPEGHFAWPDFSGSGLWRPEFSFDF